jgi:hypothetical protein
VTVCWYALVDPSWENMGLIADASKLPPDGKGAEFRQAYTAIQTAALLLNGATSVEGITAGETARAYRMRDRNGMELVVAWADDAKGAGATASVKLPLKQGAWQRLEWDFARSGAPKETVTVASDGLALDVTTMPVFFRQVR